MEQGKLFDDSAFEVVANFEEALDFSPVPAGEYAVRVTAVEHQTSKAGNPMLKWQLLIEGPTHAGRILFDRTLLTGPAAWRTKAILKALHDTVENELGPFEAGGTFRFSPPTYVGKRVVARVEVDEATGNNNVRGYRPITNLTFSGPAF